MKVALLFLFGFVVVQLSAQKPQGDGIVLGKIIDQTTKKPLEYAKIKLFKAQDSSLVFGQFTDAEGKFNLEGLS